MFKLPSALTYLVAQFDEVTNRTKDEVVLSFSNVYYLHKCLKRIIITLISSDRKSDV